MGVCAGGWSIASNWFGQSVTGVRFFGCGAVKPTSSETGDGGFWLACAVGGDPAAGRCDQVLQRLRLSRAEQKFCGQLAQSNPAQIFAELSAPNWRQSAFIWMGARPITPVRYGGLVKFCDLSITSCYMSGKRHSYQFQAQTYCRTALTMGRHSATC